MRCAAITLVALLGTAGAAAAACPAPDEDPRVRVVIRAPETEYRRDQDRASLTTMGRDDLVLSHHQQALGLTVSGFVSRIEVQSWVSPRPDGGVCAGVQSVDAVLEIPEMTVFVASEYRRGSCQSRAITGHENQHVTRTRGLLRPHGRRLKRGLAEAAAAVSPVVAAHPRQAEDRIQASLHAALQTVMRDLDAERRRVNAEIDTDDAYRRVLRSCRNW